MFNWILRQENSVGMITTNSTDEYVLQKNTSNSWQKYVLEADVLADSSTTLERVYLTVKEVNNGKQGKLLNSYSLLILLKGKKRKIQN